MFTNSFNSYLYNVKKFGWVLVLPLIVGIFLSSCGDSPIDAQTDFTDSSQVNNNIEFIPEQFNAVGTIQGTIIDQSSSEGLSDVAVSLNFQPEGAEEPSIITDTTNGEGTFSFTGVPVNSDGAEGFNTDNSNSPYTLKITTEELDNYRDLYRYNANLAFESTGGDGAATNLVSDVTIPLNEQAVTVNGKLHTSDGKILSDVNLELYQSISPIMNGSAATADVLLDDTTTAEDGSFTFEGVEKNADLVLKATDDSNPSNIIKYENDNYSTGTKATEDLGVVKVSSSDIEDETGAFYVKEVTPAPGTDLSEKNSVFTYVFNRPVVENSWTNADAEFGEGSFKDAIYFEDDGVKKAPGDVDFSVSWGETRDTLIIDPDESTLSDANKYTLDVRAAFDNNTNGNNVGYPLNTGPIATENGNFVDEYGKDLTYGPSDYDAGEIETLEFSVGVNKSAPHTPSISLTQHDSDTVDWNNGSADLTWNIDNSSTEVKKYEVYVSRDGGAYKHFMTETPNEANFGEFTFTIDGVTSSSGQGDFDNPVPNNDAFNDLTVTNENSGQAVSYEVKVRAISTNLVAGDFSDPVTFEDVKMPDVTNVVRGSGNDDNHLYVEFSEPMNASTAETTGNYAILDGGGSSIDADISDATYNRGDIDDPNGATGYDLRLTVASGDLDSGSELQVKSAVTDLADNAMSNDNNTQAW